MKTVLLRLSGFTLLPLLSLVIPLMLLPVISSFVGGTGIASVMSGQAIGTFAATVIMWGWNIDGPIAIARAATTHDRSAIYLSSIRTRLVLLIIVLPVTAVLTAIVVLPEFRVEAISMALASAFVGMSPAWYCIGLGRPRLLALFDTVPRFLATLVSIPILMLTHQLWAYTVILGGATAFALVLFHRGYSRGGKWYPTHLTAMVRELKSQAHTASINVAGNSYGSTPVPIATATTSPAMSGALATADTLYRYGLFSVVALGNALQAWVLDQNTPGERRRQILAIVLHAILGVVGAIILTVLGPTVSSLIFAGQARADTLVCFYYGIAFAFISASTPLIRNLIIPAGKSQLVLLCTVASAGVGVAGMIIAGLFGQASGIALSMAGSELILFSTLLIPGLRILNGKQEA
ncbi:polysaccharide biosynthesis protein [Arthrobacter sp. AQ5-05]|uniref:polysaccharide biosynthesis protein n=1 Tax=Arthrobacter sp. AQ5-05 TaxID=2184581 RepID=UPI0012B56E17|nr:polysaccharide biosynthesis protein [Arthrobacter sp. AQ5-05]